MKKDVEQAKKKYQKKKVQTRKEKKQMMEELLRQYEIDLVYKEYDWEDYLKCTSRYNQCISKKKKTEDIIDLI